MAKSFSTRNSKSGRTAPAPRGGASGFSLLAEIPFGSGLTLRRYRLGNGLVVMSLPDSSTPLCSYHTWFRVGSRHEKKGKTGLAHLFEHLMFGQTEHLPHGELDRRIEAEGGETNAATWTDWTHYHTELPKAGLPTMVEIESERMQNLVLRAPQVKSEKEVVQNERRFRVDDDVEGAVNEKLYALAFKRHPYRHPTIGWMRDIEGFTPADCRAFYKTYYAPNNATIVVAGNFDEQKVLKLIEARYGSIPAAAIPEPPRIVEQPQTAERKHVMHAATPTEKLALGYRAPSFGDADYPTLSLLNELLFVGRGARVFQRLVRKEQLAADVTGGIAPFVDPGLYDIWVGMRPGKRARTALRVLDEELDRVRQRRVTAREIERVKNRSELGFLLSLESVGGKAEQIGFYEVVLGDAAQLFARIDQFRSVSAADVQRVAERVLDRRSRTCIEVLPEPKKRGAAA